MVKLNSPVENLILAIEDAYVHMRRCMEGEERVAVRADLAVISACLDKAAMHAHFVDKWGGDE
jgi:hypothetical protein